MSHKPWIIVVLLLITFHSGIIASEKCDEKDWKCQAMENFVTADAELNQVYLNAFEVINESPLTEKERDSWKKQLRRSQHNWIRFRDEDCKAIYYSWQGGSGVSFAHSDCLTYHTMQRIESLEMIYEMQ